MGRKRNQRILRKGQILELEIEKQAYEGKGIGYYSSPEIAEEDQRFVVFVPGAIQGQLVRVRISTCKKRYAEAKLEEVLTPSDIEIKSPYFTIPGAPYITLPPAHQQAQKEDAVFHFLRQFAQIPDPETLYDGYIDSPSLFHYRNKMEYTFSAIRWNPEEKTDVDEFSLGFKKRGTWWLVENLESDSGLFQKEWEDTMPRLRTFFQETGLPAWHPPKKTGFFRQLAVRYSFFQKKYLVELTTSSLGIEQFDTAQFVSFLEHCFPDKLAGILHSVNDGLGDRTTSLSTETTVLAGEDILIEEICELKFQLKISSFFQTNPQSAELLYKKAVEYTTKNTSYSSQDYIMDLFCGTGTIAQILASSLSEETQILGVDIVEDAIKDAKENAERNHLNHIQFFANDVGKFLSQHPEFRERIATVILDPPRAGISPKTIAKVLSLQAKRIVYISCNPATQARDIALMQEQGYHLQRFSIVNQFPHTAHIECVAYLDKTKD